MLIATFAPRILAIRDEINALLLHREQMVDATLASLLSGVPLVIFGPPGTAKSACVQLIAQLCAPGNSKSTDRKISKACFEYLITSHTMPEEIFGPPDLDALRGGVFKRRTDGMLPESEFAFLDEVFRGGGHILNTLLSVINEKRFHNGQSVMKTPLLGVVAAGNTPPSDPETAAFYDRFPVRLWIESILDHTGSETADRASNLLARSLGHERQRLRVADGEKLTTLACTNDFRLANRRLAGANYGGPHGGDMTPRREEFINVLLRLRQRHRISDRSVNALWRFGCALDWVRSNTIDASCNSGEGDSATGHLDALAMVGATESDARHCANIIDDYKNGLSQTSSD